MNSKYPTNTKHPYNICTTSAQRLLRWSNVVQMLDTCFVFTGYRPQKRGCCCWLFVVVAVKIMLIHTVLCLIHTLLSLWHQVAFAHFLSYMYTVCQPGIISYHCSTYLEYWQNILSHVLPIKKWVYVHSSFAINKWSHSSLHSKFISGNPYGRGQVKYPWY